MGKIVDKVSAEDLNAGKLRSHLVKTLGKFLKFFGVLQMKLNMEIAFGNLMDCLDNQLDGTERQVDDAVGKRRSCDDADHPALEEKRNERASSIVLDQSMADEKQEYDVAEEHGDDQKEENHTHGDQGKLCSHVGVFFIHKESSFTIAL